MPSLLQTRPLHLRAFAVASEIGPDFSPDIRDSHRMGFSPWDKPSFPAARVPARWPPLNEFLNLHAMPQVYFC